MNWQQTVNARGWKVPFVGKSLFQIGKELRPKIDRVIMRNSRIPDAAVQDKAFFPWIAELERHWETIRDEAVAIRAKDIPSLGDISLITGASPPTVAGARSSSRATATGSRPMPRGRRSPPR